jgi:hypothetical protein
VNKTIEYAVNEALNIGRLSANVKFYEAELREKIAQEIEAQIESLSLQDGLFKSGMIGACAIVRGKRD